MKKTFTRVFLMAAMILAGVTGTSAQVDNTFRFVDEEGNVIPDGGVVYSEAVKKDKIPGMPQFGFTLQADFDLFVENTATDVAYVSLEVTTVSMSNGGLTVCFPIVCDANVPKYYTTDTGALGAGMKQSLQSEWIPEGEGKYGTAEFTVQLRVMDATLNNQGIPVSYAFKAYGPKVTIKCNYADPTGIDDVVTEGAQTVNVYDMLGRAVVTGATSADVQTLAKGTYVFETVKDGKRVTVKKIVK